MQARGMGTRDERVHSAASGSHHHRFRGTVCNGGANRRCQRSCATVIHRGCFDSPVSASGQTRLGRFRSRNWTPTQIRFGTSWGVHWVLRIVGVREQKHGCKEAPRPSVSLPATRPCIWNAQAGLRYKIRPSAGSVASNGRCSTDRTDCGKPFRHSHW